MDAVQISQSPRYKAYSFLPKFFPCLYLLFLFWVVGFMDVPSKAFLLFFLLPDWLKLNHLKVEWNVIVQTFFRAIFVPP